MNSQLHESQIVKKYRIFLKAPTKLSNLNNFGRDVKKIYALNFVILFIYFLILEVLS